jgi:UDP-N-acetylmuramoyl-L-alanyl-D-glutamate--2,6-diaminopimelate ligase
LAEQLPPGRIAWRYGTGAGDQLRAEAPRLSITGIEATVETPRGRLALRSPLVGAHNLENLLCAAGLALAAGLPAGAVEAGLSVSQGAPGRLERVDGGGLPVFVDYAHTGDALARAVEALRALGPRRLLLVFGCGGDRDRGKRPQMGQAAGRGAELAIVTSDNPRGEDPLRIIAEIEPGLSQAGRARLTRAEALAGEPGYLVEPDRRAAIELALACARPGDAVLVAGKGHESYQLVGSERRHFDDREEARRALGLA